MVVHLKSGDIVFIDTAPFIYYFENHDTYANIVETVLNQIATVQARAVTSLVTYIEIITQPLRQGNRGLAAKYREYFMHSPSITLYPLDLHIAEETGRIRAKHSFRTPDAIQLATATVAGADYILTNDRKWKDFPRIPVLLLEEL